MLSRYPLILCGLLVTLQPILLLFVLDLQFHCPDTAHSTHSYIGDFFYPTTKPQQHPPPLARTNGASPRFLSTSDLILPIKRTIFKGLPQDPPYHNKNGERLRVLLVTKDLVGPLKNGGIGTAFTELSLSLAAEGYNVTVLFAAKIFEEQEAEGENEQGKTKNETEKKKKEKEKAKGGWVGMYEKAGVEVVVLPPSKYVNTYQGSLSSHEARCAYETYLWMVERDGEYDVVHFHEWLGLPYFVTLSKHQGLHFRETLLVVQTHGPLMWSSIGGKVFPVDYNTIQSDFMERKAVEYADVIISPSRFMLTWMQENGWVLPQRVYRQFNLRREYLRVGAEVSQREAEGGEGRRYHVNELVFFGRLETRKGVYLFLDALDILLKGLKDGGGGSVEGDSASEGEGDLRKTEWGRNSYLVTFLGKFRQGRNNPWSDIMKIKREKRWGGNVRIQFLRDMDYREAVSYLQENTHNTHKTHNTLTRRIALMPSLTENSPYTVLECLAMGIPFGATNVGGTAELVREAERDSVLFHPDPHSFAEFLRRAIVRGVQIARPSFDLTQNHREWMKWHASLPHNTDNTHNTHNTHYNDLMVSVIITSHNRGKLLREAVESVRAQTYRNFEIVVTDDASDDKVTQRELALLSEEFNKEDKGWQVYISPTKGILSLSLSLSLSHSNTQRTTTHTCSGCPFNEE